MSQASPSTATCGTCAGVGIRRVLACLILTGFGLLHLYSAVGGMTRGWAAVCAVVFGLGDLVAVYALWRRYFWARWLGQGIAVVGALNCAALGLLWVSQSAFSPTDAEVIFYGVQGAAFVALFALLTGRKLAAGYDFNASPRNRWDLSEAPVRLLRWALVLNIAAWPMLFKYIGSGAAGCGTRMLCIALSVTLFGALVLVTLQRTIGLLLLAASGIGTIVVAADAAAGLSAMLQPQPFTCGFAYGLRMQAIADTAMIGAAFIPGAIAAVAVFAVFVGPMVRFLRRG